MCEKVTLVAFPEIGPSKFLAKSSLNDKHKYTVLFPVPILS